MFVRYTPARTTSSKPLPAALRTAERFRKTRSVSATMPPSTTLPVAGSWATCPLKKRKPSILTAWENGPTGGAISGDAIAVLLMATSRGWWLAGMGHMPRKPVFAGKATCGVLQPVSNGRGDGQDPPPPINFAHPPAPSMPEVVLLLRPGRNHA